MTFTIILILWTHGLSRKYVQPSKNCFGEDDSDVFWEILGLIMHQKKNILGSRVSRDITRDSKLYCYSYRINFMPTAGFLNFLFSVARYLEYNTFTYDTATIQRSFFSLLCYLWRVLLLPKILPKVAIVILFHLETQIFMEI